MYKEHPVFLAPEDENIEIWRYMDFTKFVSLLDKRSLYFCRVDKLGDPFEGSLTEMNVKARNDFLVEYWKGKIKNQQLAELMEREPKFNDKARQTIFVNCWYMSEYESAAMWKLYLKSNEGIAIQSTYKKLKESFDKNSKDDIYIGRVKYIDYSSEVIPRVNFFSAAMHKRKSFEYERELRAMIWDTVILGNIMGSDKESYKVGKYVGCDLEVLINKVYLGPETPDWFGELVRSLLKKYRLRIEVERSKLDAKALF
jgi:hypothetical protein